jgi:hypothetical protein
VYGCIYLFVVQIVSVTSFNEWGEGTQIEPVLLAPPSPGMSPGPPADTHSGGGGGSRTSAAAAAATAAVEITAEDILPAAGK